jgi:acyl carrier protein
MELGPSVASADKRLDLDAFVAYLSDELEIPIESLRAATRFVKDLGFDSVRVLELSIVIEELGVELDDEDLEGLDTVARAYEVYKRAVLTRNDETG